MRVYVMPNAVLKSVLTYVLFLLAGALGAISDTALNQWAKSNRTFWLVTAYALWLMVATVLGQLLRWGYLGFSGSVAVFTLTNLVVASLIDRFVYAGQMSRYQIAGLVCAGVAVLLFEIGRGQGDR